MRLNTGIAAFLAVTLAGVGYYAWQKAQGNGLPADIAFGNGRIEAVQVDIASLVPGRVSEVTVKEGDLVHPPDQIVARVDADAIRAQLAQAEAQVAAAQAQVAAGSAAIAQAQAVLNLARDEAKRTGELVTRGTSPPQALLDARLTDVSVAEANLAAAQAALVAHERSVDAARAAATQIATNLDDTELTAPAMGGRVLYRLVEPGEVIGGAGTRVMTMVDLSEVYLEFYLPATQAHLVPLGSEARIKLDVADAVVPATVTFVSPVSQFTPRQVETADERQNLVFRVRVRVPQELVETYIEHVRTGMRGVAYVRLAPEPGTQASAWPEALTPIDLSTLPALND